MADTISPLFPLPHPSWRSQLGARENPWFESEVLPEPKKHVARALSESLS